MLEDKNSQEELRSRIEAFKLMAVLFILFLFATLSFVFAQTDWGQKFSNVAQGTDALELTFRFLIHGAMMVIFSVLTVMTGGSLIIGAYRLYVDWKAQP